MSADMLTPGTIVAVVCPVADCDYPAKNRTGLAAHLRHQHPEAHVTHDDGTPMTLEGAQARARLTDPGALAYRKLVDAITHPRPETATPRTEPAVPAWNGRVNVAGGSIELYIEGDPYLMDEPDRELVFSLIDAIRGRQ